MRLASTFGILDRAHVHHVHDPQHDDYVPQYRHARSCYCIGFCKWTHVHRYVPIVLFRLYDPDTLAKIYILTT